MPKAKTTCAIILNKNNEVLLIKRGREPYNGYWALVSGVYESQKGFPPDEAIKREVSWDLGTKSFAGSQVFSLPIVNDEIIRLRSSSYGGQADEVIVYVGSINESEIQLKPGFSEEVKWVPLEQAAKQVLAFEHAEIIEKYTSFKATGYSK